MRQAVARAERKLETPVIIGTDRRPGKREREREKRDASSAAPPGTIIRRRGTLKYPSCPIGRRSPVTPLRYAQERNEQPLRPATLCTLSLSLSLSSSSSSGRFHLSASALFPFSLCFFFIFFFPFFLSFSSRTRSATTQHGRGVLAAGSLHFSAGYRKNREPVSKRERPPETAEPAC